MIDNVLLLTEFNRSVLVTVAILLTTNNPVKLASHLATLQREQEHVP